MSSPVNSKKKPAVLAVSSHVARGSVGNRAVVFALETFGYPVWAIPTIILPWHPGHGPSTRLSHDSGKFEQFSLDIAMAPWVSELGAVLTGYMANADQVTTIANLIRELKSKDPKMIYLCDPVIGDNGGLYVEQETALAIRDKLLPLCDIATPNSFEISWLSDAHEPRGLDDAYKLSQALGPKVVLTTSVLGKDKTKVGNILVKDGAGWATFHARMDGIPNGVGDLTASIFLAHHLAGTKSEKSLTLTTSAVLDVLQHSANENSNELILERCSASLSHPENQLLVKDLNGAE